MATSVKSEGIKFAQDAGAVAGSSKSLKTTIADGKTRGTPASTVIRLKRRIEDNPSKILVVSYKRQKVAESSDNQDAVELASSSSSALGTEANNQFCSRVLRLVGTVAVSDDEAGEGSIETVVRNALESSTVIKSGPKIEFRHSVKSSNIQIASKARQRFKQNLEDGRFKLVNLKRGLDFSEEKENDGRNGWAGQKELLNLLDLVPQTDADEGTKKRVPPKGFEPGNVTCNGVPMVKEFGDVDEESKIEDKNGFVYDLYLTNEAGIDDFSNGPSQIVSVEKGNDELDFGESRDNADEQNDGLMDDEDSNAEDNYRNDYPDTEEEGSGDDGGYYYGSKSNRSVRLNHGKESSDDEVCENFNGLKVRDDSSSDDDLIYGIEDDEPNYPSNNYFSKRYANYKRQMKNQYADEVVSSSSDDED